MDSFDSIKKITIENFQSHQNTIITPAPKGQLTVITGPSDAGKTVILRALRWLLFNEPQGSDFIRVGASFARVTAEMESGHKVVRKRTKATNRYEIIAPDTEKQGTPEAHVFEGFGSSVPLEVQEITGVRPVAIGDLSINLNLAEQLDGPFLGSSISAPARAKVLGKLAGTEEIDFAGKELGTDLYRRNQDEKRLVDEAAELEEQLEEFDWLPAMGAKIEVLEGLVASIKASQRQLMELEHKRDRYSIVQENIYACLVGIERWNGLTKAENLVLKIPSNVQTKKTLTILLDSFWAYQKIVWASEETIKHHALLPDTETLLQSVQKSIEKNNLLENLITKFNAVSNAISQLKNALTKLRLINESAKMLQGVMTLKQRIDSLSALTDFYKSANMAAVTAQNQNEVLVNIKLAEVLAGQVTDNQVRWARLCALRNWHKDFVGKVDAACGQKILYENRVIELQGAYHDLLDMTGVCPMCGQTIDNKKNKEAV